MNEMTASELRSTARRNATTERPAALLRERRLQIAFDPTSGAYRLAMS